MPEETIAEAQPKKRGRKPGVKAFAPLDWRTIAHNNLENQRHTLLLAIGESMCAGGPREACESLIYRALALKTALDAVDAIPES